ncbi:hypothetical protein B0H66DRAFT_142141 [Apodospora peruviana]|uniref:AN1-type domain-containing protein n=1 Tax=Apodospora peruviana TaxID=516989 RepID=A0AAE0IJ26_9PEZI|nr:hypothetical protein B0H66DRAFT_142141 [Apodospora peruviana]
MPPKRVRCSFSDCKLAAQRISGDCAFCNGHYCNNHRLLEDHKCQNLEDVSTQEPEWWLVGLSDVLLENSFADLFRDSPRISARRKRLSKTPCSSTRSEPKSSRVSKRRKHKNVTKNRPTTTATAAVAVAADTAVVAGLALSQNLRRRRSRYRRRRQQQSIYERTPSTATMMTRPLRKPTESTVVVN